MADFRSSEIINKPVHEVFNYMVRMENAPELMPYVVKVEKQTEGEIGKGTKFIETRMVRGKNIKADVEIIDFEKDKTYTTRSNANGLITEYKYDFHEIEEGTQVEMEANVKTSGLVAKLTKRFIVNIVKQEDGSQLQYLKEMLGK
ncbi:SRPBCC family protein [Bacillus sp. ISL-47]|uniref:SRPBCC family protein n=1 Tax=Bacillus sp. ISL-47 TaxID=2819130 RepID=UPI001BE5F6F2|nr:SRPBCC family protein [Bacillus sp. ISL-47]MBT2687339.1 SRPBCC family protein [Bacillus sp. ISL-47]MBT2706591.1 SRPBCC family protein [Pseudomonas sp. ISL-84]